MKKYLLKNKLFYLIYKLIKIYRNKKPSSHYGEFGEDIFVSRLFKDFKKGRYIDVGCYHPFKGSLTAKLYEKGWNGVNIDLSQTTIDLFNIARKKDINLNIAVTNFDGETFYYENSPINQQNSLIKSNEQQLKVKIKCSTLNSILKQNNIDSFDYLNIDLVLEDYFKSKVYELLMENGYALINRIGVTNFFIRNDIKGKISELIKI